MTKAILEAISNRIAEVKELKHVDEDWAQLDVDNERPPVMFPCALIDFEEGDFEDLGKDKTRTPAQRQTAEIKVIITVATVVLSRSNQKATAQQKEDAWKIYDIIQKVHEKIHGWNPIADGSGKMKRVQFRKQRTVNGTKQIRMEYSLSVVNC
jgi:hypothetical protein